MAKRKEFIEGCPDCDKEKDIHKLAVAIADDLFTNGSGDTATRLVMLKGTMEMEEPRNIGGWNDCGAKIGILQTSGITDGMLQFNV